jgi:hypothetical protein
VVSAVLAELILFLFLFVVVVVINSWVFSDGKERRQVLSLLLRSDGLRLLRAILVLI